MRPANKTEKLEHLRSVVRQVEKAHAGCSYDHVVVGVAGVFVGELSRGRFTDEDVKEVLDSVLDIGRYVQDEFCLEPPDGIGPDGAHWTVTPISGDFMEY